MKYIYGLDLSLSQTGISVYDLEDNKFVCITSINTDKVKKVKDKYHNALKLKYIEEEMNKIADLYPPSLIVIERGFSRFNTATQTIFRVHGMINYMFYDLNQIYYPPKKVKEIIFHGDATKEQLANIMNLRLGLEFKNEDESDACAVALSYLIKENHIDWIKEEVIKPKKKAKKSTKKVKE